MKAFIPSNLYVKVEKKHNSITPGMKKVKYCSFREENGVVYLDQYYHRNFARHKRITCNDCINIDGVMESITDDVIGLYNKTFGVAV